MKYIVYLTRNLKSKVNGINRIYIGVHQTEHPEIFDGYLGCGVYAQQPSTYMYPKTPFQYAVKKYGTDSFERIILYIYELEEEAYKKEAELVDINFLKLSHTYNACAGEYCYKAYKPLFQFDLQGNLKKKWKCSKEAYDFYGLPIEKFQYAVQDKHPLLNSFWSTREAINVSEYSTKTWGEPEVTHLYNKDGKWLGEFISRRKCAEYIGTSENSINNAIVQNSLVNNLYYVSDSLYDLYIPKARKQYTQMQFYVYNKDSKLIGQGKGKEIMSIIDEHSWKTISDAIRYKHGWYKDFFISTVQIDKVPEKTKGIKVDVYDKFGNYIETLGTVKEVRQKYNVPSSKIKNLELGDRYFEEYIFKYHRKLSK